MNKTKLTVEIDSSLHTNFKVMCAAHNVSIKDVMAQMIESCVKEYISNQNKGPKND